MILLPGNHDQINVQGENALEILGSHTGVSVYTKPTNDRFGFWIPYRKKLEEVEKAVREFEPWLKASPKILWMHHGVRGALMNNGLANKEGSSGEFFSAWDYVFSGHYHRRQKVGRIYYIGSPYQTRADEAGQEKGYAVWHWKTKQIRWVNKIWGKRYHQIRTDGSPINLIGMNTRDELRVITDVGVDPELIGKQLTSQGFTNVTINPAIQANQARLQVGAAASLLEYAQAYAKEKGEMSGLDFSKLMEFYNQFSGGV
jgi:hypothetical protein